MNVKIESSWREVLKTEFQQDYFIKLTDFVKREYQSTICYPSGKDVFNAFNLCPFDNVKVVIIGQDPYINPGQAHGLCFSVQSGTKFPPSLNNIYKELKEDVQKEISSSGDLTHWAEQGVLLLNSTLTVRAGQSNSHEGKGWGVFTDAVIRELNAKKEGVVYILWGSFAKRKAKTVDPNKNLILNAVHPSPLSAHRGFFGCKHFSKANTYLKENGADSILW